MCFRILSATDLLSVLRVEMIYDGSGRSSGTTEMDWN